MYWEGVKLKRPLVGFRIGGYLFSRYCSASEKLMVPGKEITPSMVNVDEFIEDYERISFEIESIGQDAFWTAEPYNGFPWLEAICGCKVYATGSSFISRHAHIKPEEYDSVVFNPDNAWYAKYMEFIEKLNKVFSGRFPMGQPILRGILDVFGALAGQEEMIYAIYDHPDEVKALLRRIVNIFLTLVENRQKLISPYYGGHSIGFYHFWCPGKCIWFQDDLTSLVSPDIYRNFIKKLHEEISAFYEYSMMHLHSSSFHLIDDILDNKSLKVVEINKDVGGLTVRQMVPFFRKVQQKGKKLIIWGDLNGEDIRIIKDELEMIGIYLNIVVPDIDAAKTLMDTL
jgi:hypothetical protein